MYRFSQAHYDCGLFAITFATALALGEKPELFFFDQSKMRAHLWQCLERGRIEMFPVVRKRRVKKSSVKTVEELSSSLLQVSDARVTW